MRSRSRGDEVRALVRDPAKAAAVLPPEVQPVRGDVTEPASVAAAVAGCEVVFNAMGLPEQWLADESTFDRVNAEGTHTVARAARAAGVRRLVHTSTEDVFHAEPGERFDESHVAAYPKGTAYERSKQRAEQLALSERDGLEVVIVNPAGVYGPGPERERLLRPGAVRAAGPAPAARAAAGGLGLVYVDGLAAGHLLAAELGRDGERYILCDTHMSLRELAHAVVREAGRGWVPPTLPLPVARAMAAGGEALSRVIRRPPLLSRGQLYFFTWNAHPVATKAAEELGWTSTPLAEGLRRTLEDLGLRS